MKSREVVDTKRKWMLYVGSILVLCLIAGTWTKGRPKYIEAQKDDRSVVKIAYLPTTHSLALFALKDLQKDNPSYRIELVKYGAWTDLSDALNTGQVDGAVELTEFAMKAIQNGIPLKADALGHRDGNIIVSDKSIHTASELKGKTFAIPNRLSTHNLLLNKMLEQCGLTTDDLTILELSPAEMPFALVSGQIAGYCVAEPFGGKAVNAGVANVLYKSNELWKDSICCTLVFHNQFLKQNTLLAKQVIRDYLQAGEYLDAHKEWAEEVGSRYLSVSRDVLKVSLEWISYSDLRLTKESYQSLCEELGRDSVLTDSPSYREFAEESFYE